MGKKGERERVGWWGQYLLYVCACMYDYVFHIFRDDIFLYNILAWM